MITLRQARIEDCDFIAIGICMALHMVPKEDKLTGISQICQRSDVLYSYRHAIIACNDDTPVGICLCYDGGNYHTMRQVTFPLFTSLMNEDPDHQSMDIDNAEDEAVAGEYYIDSLAVMPQWRNQGIGFRLMQAQMDKAKSLGFKEAALLVDPDNESAQRMYTRLGFTMDRDIYAFGQTFWKWKATLC